MAALIPTSAHGGTGSSSPLTVATATLGAADFAAWDTTGTQIVAPVGAGKVARAVFAAAVAHPGTNAYAPTHADVFLADDAAFAGGQSAPFWSFAATPTCALSDPSVGQVADGRIIEATAVGTAGTDLSGLPALGGGIYAFASVPFAGGNGTYTFTVLYTVVDLTL